jgi:hypothetical protein
MYAILAISTTTIDEKIIINIQETIRKRVKTNLSAMLTDQPIVNQDKD